MVQLGDKAVLMINDQAFALFLRYRNEYLKICGQNPPWANWDRRDQRIEAMGPFIEIVKKNDIKANEALKLIVQQAHAEGSIIPPPHMVCEPWGQKLLTSALASKRIYVADAPNIGDQERCQLEVRKLMDTKRLINGILLSTYGRKFDASWPRVFSKRTAKQIESIEKLLPDAFIDFSASYRAWRNIKENRGMYMQFVHDAFDKEFHGDTRDGYESLILPR